MRCVHRSSTRDVACYTDEMEIICTNCKHARAHKKAAIGMIAPRAGFAAFSTCRRFGECIGPRPCSRTGRSDENEKTLQRSCHAARLAYLRLNSKLGGKNVSTHHEESSDEDRRVRFRHHLVCV